MLPAEFHALAQLQRHTVMTPEYPHVPDQEMPLEFPFLTYRQQPYQQQLQRYAKPANTRNTTHLVGINCNMGKSHFSTSLHVDLSCF